MAATFEIGRLIAGGQTGADQGGLRAARACGIAIGGWAPALWMTETGPAPWLEEFGLVKMPQVVGGSYSDRTRKNVAGADRVLWFGDPKSPGGRCTLTAAKNAGVGTLIVWQGTPAVVVTEWLRSWRACPVVMVAGNRESKSAGIGDRVETYLVEVFGLLGYRRVDLERDI